MLDSICFCFSAIKASLSIFKGPLDRSKEDMRKMMGELEAEQRREKDDQSWQTGTSSGSGSSSWKDKAWKEQEWKGKKQGWKGKEWKNNDWEDSQWKGKEWKKKDWEDSQWKGQEKKGKEWKKKDWEDSQWKDQEKKGKEWKGKEWKPKSGTWQWKPHQPHEEAPPLLPPVPPPPVLPSTEQQLIDNLAEKLVTALAAHMPQPMPQANLLPQPEQDFGADVPLLPLIPKAAPPAPTVAPGPIAAPGPKAAPAPKAAPFGGLSSAQPDDALEEPLSIVISDDGDITEILHVIPPVDAKGMSKGSTGSTDSTGFLQGFGEGKGMGKTMGKTGLNIVPAGEDTECLICLNSDDWQFVCDDRHAWLSNSLITPCFHGPYHWACLIKSLEQRMQCPQCRTFLVLVSYLFCCLLFPM